jgi:hypothetical protein
MPKFRMYIDEVGDASLKASMDANNRYLSLTGVILDLAYVDSTLAPDMEALKRRYFKTHVDDPIIFHRKELAGRLYPFRELLDTEVEQLFNEDLLTHLEGWNYTAMTVIIDKLRHKEQYRVWQYDPYHYCLLILIERFVLWLQKKGDETFVGDVLAEGRGGKEDLRLKASFERVCDNGSDFVSKQAINQRLTSKQLKIKQKVNNIAGLQLADMIAHPSFKATLARHQRQAIANNFGGRIALILEKSKYDRNKWGQINGYGRKLLP